MVAKGKITSIDYSPSANTCTIWVPIFDSATSVLPTEITATIMVTPGSSCNYKINDTVFVAFENNSIEKPVVIGKLYLGTAEEATTGNRGTLNVEVANISSELTIPISTKINYSSDGIIDVLGSKYTSLKEVFTTIKNNTDKIDNLIKVNPEQAIEKSLDKIMINGVIYGISGGGSKLYKHNFTYYANNRCNCYWTIYSNKETNYTFTEFSSYVTTKGFITGTGVNGDENPYLCGGILIRVSGGIRLEYPAGTDTGSIIFNASNWNDVVQNTYEV